MGKTFPLPVRRATGRVESVGWGSAGFTPVCKRASPPPLCKNAAACVGLLRIWGKLPAAHPQGDGRSESAGWPGCGRLYGLHTRLQAGIYPVPLAQNATVRAGLLRIWGKLSAAHPQGDGRSESAGWPGCGRLYGLYTRLQAGVPAPCAKRPCTRRPSAYMGENFPQPIRRAAVPGWWHKPRYPSANSSLWATGQRVTALWETFPHFFHRCRTPHRFPSSSRAASREFPAACAAGRR